MFDCIFKINSADECIQIDIIDDIFVESTIQRINSNQVLNLEKYNSCKTYSNLFEFIMISAKKRNYDNNYPFENTFSCKYEIHKNFLKINSSIICSIKQFISMTLNTCLYDTHNYLEITHRHLINNQIYPNNYDDYDDYDHTHSLILPENLSENLSKTKLINLDSKISNKIKIKLINKINSKIKLIETVIPNKLIKSESIYLMNLKLLKLCLEFEI